MNAPMVVVLVVSLGLSSALAYMVWRLDRRAERRAVAEAERIVRVAARRSYWEVAP